MDQLYIPKFDELFQPAMDALNALGGSASVQEMYEKVCEIKNFSEE